MDFILSLTLRSLEQVLQSVLHNWPYLLLSILIASALKLYTKPEKISAFLMRSRGVGVIAATTAAVATPFCSCGTTAVLLGMMASMMPWAPIVAFMVASPLTSPSELIYSAGLFGWPFAIAFFAASILLGLVGGWAAAVLDKRGWLKNQTRFDSQAQSTQTLSPASSQAPAFVPAAASACGCSTPPLRTAPVITLSTGLQAADGCGCQAAVVLPDSLPISLPAKGGASVKPKVPVVQRVNELAAEMFSSGKKLVLMFLGFAFVGYFLNGLIPESWVTAIFGGGHIYSVPLAATLGLPFYINSEASLPLVRALIDGGMSQGAALAFLISGSGTSIGAIAGALTIARWRVVGLVVATLWVGAIFSGFVYDFVLAMGLF